MVLPLIKVMSLVVKSASKPMARQIKRTAATNPRFQAVVVGAARAWHTAEGRLSIFVGDRLMKPKYVMVGRNEKRGEGDASNTQPPQAQALTPTPTRQLNVQAAVDLGSELASEGFLLSIAVVLLLLENKRSSNKDKAKEEKVKRRFAELEDSLEKQKVTIDGLQAQLEVLGNKSGAMGQQTTVNKG